MNVFFRIRGVLSTAIVWAAGWAALAFPVFALLLRPPLGLADIALIARGWGVAGAGAGATFALLVIAFERRRTLAKFSPRRAATWGALAGAAHASITIARFLAEIERPGTEVATSIVVGGLLGGASAALTVALAHRSNTVKTETRTASRRTSPSSVERAG